MSTPFRYHYAVVCRIPNSFRESSIRSNPEEPIDIDRARRQHEEYIETLRKLGVDILELPADERHPDCTFVEDCAVIINGTALICRPGAHTRMGEEAVIRQTLKRDLGLKIVEIENDKATLEGGDVLFTGKEIIVGISSRTNIHGAQAVANAFPEYPTTIVKVSESLLHLKSGITVLSEHVLAVGSSAGAQKMLREIIEHTSYGYKVVHLPEDRAANVLYVNEMIVHQHPKYINKSFPIFESKFDNRIAVDFSELGKADGSLTCCALLIQKIKHPKYVPTLLEGGQHQPGQ